MEIIEALRIFGIDSLDEINKDNIKKIYRAKMKLNHPDIGGSDKVARELNEAKDVLDLAIESIEMVSNGNNNGVKTVIITFGDLLKIYNGETIKVLSNDNLVDIDKRTINRYNVIVDIRIEVQYNGVSWEYQKFELKSIRDEFSITCRYRVSNIGDSVNTTIRAYEKNININLTEAYMNMNLTYNGIVKLKVMFERQLISSGK